MTEAQQAAIDAPDRKLSAGERRLMASVAAAVGLLLLAAFGWNQFERAASGNNDFIGLYAAGRMAGDSGAALYDPARVAEVQRRATGFSGDGIVTFSRLPYYAALLWPLARLPFPIAYAVWEILSLSAIVGFAFAWPDRRYGRGGPVISDKLVIMAACAWSLPLLVTLMNGQDCAFVLLFVALAMRWFERRPMLAGLALALAGIKFHLLVLVPLIAIAQRRYRFLGGLTMGAAVLLAASYAVAGPHWFGNWMGLVTSDRLNPSQGSMPNLHGLALGAPRLEWTLMIAVALLTWIVVRRSVELGWAAVLIGSLLISRHAYTQDCVVLLPACLILLRHQGAVFRSCAFALLTPVVYLPGVMANPAAALLPAFLLILLGGLAVQPAIHAFTNRTKRDSVFAG